MLVGRDGAQLDENYAESLYSYLQVDPCQLILSTLKSTGIGVPGFPKYFCKLNFLSKSL